MKLRNVTAGLVLIAAGIWALTHSILRILVYTFVGEPTPNPIHFYWSFSPPPFTVIPVRIILTNTVKFTMIYEILLPLLIIGLALVAAGVFILLRGRSAKYHGDRQIATNSRV